MATVIYEDFSYGEVPDNQVDVLVKHHQIIGYKRFGLWVATTGPGAIHGVLPPLETMRKDPSSSLRRP